jgi:hypothetical protein
MLISRNGGASATGLDPPGRAMRAIQRRKMQAHDDKKQSVKHHLVENFVRAKRGKLLHPRIRTF